MAFRIGNGSNPNGQLWYGRDHFPGFLFKKNMAVGSKRSTKFVPGGVLQTNTYQNIYNNYRPGLGGVGGSSIAVRRAKNRLATICQGDKCFNYYNKLGIKEGNFQYI